MIDRITEYKKPNAFKYGLKINSSFEEVFQKVVEAGGEVIEIKRGAKQVLENDMKKSRLLIVKVGEGASFEYREKCADSVSVKNDIHIILAGVGSKASIVGRYNIGGESKLDIYHKVYHRALNTVSNISARGVLRGSANIIYRSNIVMEKGMKGLFGAEAGKFLVLSKEAKVDAIPSLDIASNDVACSHSFSISRITDEELFYPRLRGYSNERGKELIISGFLNHYV